jgi:hypothetical protein
MNNNNNNQIQPPVVGIGCGVAGCQCTYCNGDNYDRYMLDHCVQMLNEINHSLDDPVNSDDARLYHNDRFDEELFYKVIKRRVIHILESVNQPSDNQDQDNQLSEN